MRHAQAMGYYRTGSLSEPSKSSQIFPCDSKLMSVKFARWVSIESFSCVIESLLFTLSVHLLWSLYMPLGSKTIIAGAFSSRLLYVLSPLVFLPKRADTIPIIYRIIIPTAFRIHYLQNNILQDADTTFASINAVIATQVVLHFSLIAATIPCMKPFLAAFENDLGYNVKSMVGASGSGSRHARDGGGYILHSVSHHNKNEDDDVITPDRRSRLEGGGTRKGKSAESEPHVDVRSICESDGSDTMIIRKTQEVWVSSEPQP